MKKGFTLIELVVAVALLAMVISFASVIFRVSIEAYRTAGANTEIMQKLRAVTDQLNRDFEGLQKDGCLILRFEERNNRREFENSDVKDFRADRLYYFCAGDFQSWFASNIRSNIARVYFGHDEISLTDDEVVVSEWKLARDIVLLTPDNSSPPDDCNDVSFAECKVDLVGVLENPYNVLDGVEISIDDDVNDVRRLMCQNAGEMRIEWTDGTITSGKLEWKGNPDDTEVWNPYIQAPWPKAIKFTFTLYDSKGIIENGRRFTHIVYLGD